MENFYIRHQYEYNTKIYKMQPSFFQMRLALSYQYVKMMLFISYMQSRSE